jgi:MFS family permease
LVFHQVSIFAGMGLHASLAPTTMTVMAFMSMFGTLTGGYLVDKFPTRYILASSQGIVIIAMVWALGISQPWEALIYGGLLGLGGGLFMTTSTVIWPNYFGRNYLGSIRGAATTANVGFAAIGPVAFSLLFDLTGNFSSAIMVFLPLPATCALAAYLARPPIRGTITKR